MEFLVVDARSAAAAPSSHGSGPSGTVRTPRRSALTLRRPTLNNGSAGSSMGITGATGGTTANTTTNQTLELQADWSASGQTLHCDGSTLETIAPLF